MKGERKSLVQLFVPISLELLCFMLAGMVDTMMLSAVNNDAVGAVGTANTYIGMFIIMFSVITSGMIAVMTQYIRAIFMMLCGAGGTYYFGIHLELMAVGAFIGMALDECARAVCMVLRWRTGRWKNMKLIGE